MTELLKLAGVLGLVLITAGVLVKGKKKEDVFFIAGGLCLLGYSIYINDLVFTVLQVIFIIAATYDFARIQFLHQ